jgi:hypothetical protein
VLLKGKVSSVLPYEYRPELDVSEELDNDLYSYYNSLIGVLRWAVELGRIDIAVEVSMLSLHLACPRVGHLDAVFHIFSYLNQYNKSILAFDPSKVSWSEADQVEYNWSDFYWDEKEAIPPNAPVPLGEPVQMTVFVDADHAGNLMTRRSRMGVLVYLNRSPILWYTKQQSTVEMSLFGSEFCALKTAVEMIKGLRYKLRMMGVEIDCPTQVRVDNQLVVKNSSLPESTLKKKSHSIAYHYRMLPTVQFESVMKAQLQIWPIVKASVNSPVHTRPPFPRWQCLSCWVRPITIHQVPKDRFNFFSFFNQ